MEERKGLRRRSPATMACLAAVVPERDLKTGLKDRFSRWKGTIAPLASKEAFAALISGGAPLAASASWRRQSPQPAGSTRRCELGAGGLAASG